jgi:HNH endonuclease
MNKVMHEIPVWVWLIGVLIAVPKVYFTLQIGRRKKNYLAFRVRRTVVCLSSYFGGFFILIKLGYKPLEALAFSFVLGVAAGLFFVRLPVRNRAIPAHIKRAVLHRDLKGARFDSTIHHIDHIVPFSKGGDHSVANLRVISKTENLRRGARMPKWRELM